MKELKISYIVKALPALALLRETQVKRIVEADLNRFLHYTPYKSASVKSFVYCMNANKRFRTIFYYRTREFGKRQLMTFSKMLLPDLDTIEINGTIGKGLMVHHSFAVISPERAGENLTVLPGVVIGRGRKSQTGNRIKPIIGDNVFIGANATVIGGIRIGNNVTIGAGAFVNKDVPDNCVVVGNPLRIIQKEKI